MTDLPSSNFSVIELKLIKGKLKGKRCTAKQAGNVCLLTIEDYCQLLIEANITPDMVGCRKGQYVLGRKNGITGTVDEGNYILGNCRFILHTENIKEANHSKSEETKCKLSIIATGRKLSEKHKQSISDSGSGIKHPRWAGWYHTPFGIFDTSYTAATAVGCSQSVILDRCKSNRDKWKEYYIDRK